MCISKTYSTKISYIIHYVKTIDNKNSPCKKLSCTNVSFKKYISISYILKIYIITICISNVYLPKIPIISLINYYLKNWTIKIHF